MSRDAVDKRLPDARRWGRYRCEDASCGWEGLRPLARGRRHQHHKRVQAVPVAVRLGVSALALLIMAGLTWGAIQMLQQFFDS